VSDPALGGWNYPKGLPEKETVTFFAAFARFEFAMMRCGYLVQIADGNRASPDWTKLSQRLGNEFFAKATAPASTVVNDPPKKLIVQGGEAIFGNPPSPAVNTKQLLEHLRQVRNNLFHGNKMFATNRQRDRQLITETLSLLKLMMQEIPGLRWPFGEPQA
jgi:hypothetical protein